MAAVLARWARFFVVAVLAGVVGVTVAQQFGSDGPWWLELSRYLPFPVALAPSLLALLISFRLGRRWVAGSAATVLLVATLAMGLVWRAGDAGPAALRVMTWNAKAAQALDRPGGIAALEREIASHRPDVVVMQDANAIRHWDGFQPNRPLFGFAHVFAEGQYVIASRLPLRDCAAALAPTGADPIGYAHCTVEAGGGAFQLLTVHFESPRSGLNAARREGFDGIDSWQRNHEARLAQSRGLAKVIPPGPLVLAGDLNAPDSSAVVRSLFGAGLRDAFASAGHGYGYTYGHTLRPAFSFLRIDHVLVSAEFGVVDAFVGGADASDHRPVIADLVGPRSR